MRARTSKAALVAVAVVLALVACGGGNGGVATDDTAEPAGAGAEPSGGGDVTPDPGMGTPRPTGSDAAVSSDAASGSATTQTRGVAGTVSDQEGPVAGALVTPTSLDTPSQAIPEVAVFSDPEGRYSWVLPAGRYRITVTADGYQEASVEAEVPARGTTTLDVRLEKN